MNLSRIFRADLFRFTLNYLLWVSVSVFVVLAIGYGSLTFGYFRDMNALIGSETRDLAARFASQGPGAVSVGIAERIQAPSFPRLFYLLVDAHGQKIAGNLARWPERLDQGEDWLGFERTLSEITGRGEAYDFVGASTQFADGSQLLVARHYKDVSEFLGLTLTVAMQAMLATIVLGSIAAVVMIALLERRIGAINDSIGGILSGDLSQRIPVAPAADDDFTRLIVNLNRMLDRIGRLMEDQKQLSDNIAHDLRTPLTRLRNRLASIEFDERGQRSEAVAELLQESDELLATFNALLRIAQIESGNPRSGFAEADLVPILRDVCEFYEPLAAEKNQSLGVELPASCAGVYDRDLLFQAFANLLDNAIKYAPQGGHISVRLEDGADGSCVTVCDDGPGIPAAEREQVFQRFYRVEESRSGHPGNGLGLSLVQAVINLHGGRVALADNRPGLRVTVQLPRTSPRGEKG
jgi:signal transduction histidine kinase